MTFIIHLGPSFNTSFNERVGGRVLLIESFIELNGQIEEVPPFDSYSGKMLRYLIKTLLQMNLFTDTLRDPSNSSELFFNLSSIPSFNTTLQLDWGNFTSSFNGEWTTALTLLNCTSLCCLTLYVWCYMCGALLSGSKKKL